MAWKKWNAAPERAIRAAGEVRRHSQEPAPVRGNWRDQARKNPNRKRLGFHYWWARRDLNPGPKDYESV